MRSETGTIVHAFRADDIDRLLAAAAAPPPSNVRSAWPARDVAIVDLLAHCGPRVSELCGLAVADIDRHGDHPLLRITTGAKGGKRRTVPIPTATLAAIDTYLEERATIADRRLVAGPRSPLFIRHNGDRLNQQFVDGLLRRLAAAAGVDSPDGAMAHALRHSYGLELALRGVPLPSSSSSSATPTRARQAFTPPPTPTTSPTPSETPACSEPAWTAVMSASSDLLAHCGPWVSALGRTAVGV